MGCIIKAKKLRADFRFLLCFQYNRDHEASFIEAFGTQSIPLILCAGSKNVSARLNVAAGQDKIQKIRWLEFFFFFNKLV